MQNNGIFSLDWANVKSAAVTVVLWALVAVAGYIVGLGDIWKIDWHVMANIGALSLLSGFISLVKNFLTSNSGSFAGVTQIQ